MNSCKVLQACKDLRRTWHDKMTGNLHCCMPNVWVSISG